MEVRASTNNFATSTPLALQALADTTVNFRLTYVLAGFPLLQNATSPVTFRIFGYAAEGAAGTFRLGRDNGEPNATLPANLAVTGRVVHEPSTIVLAGLGLGLAAISALRRRGRTP